MRANRAWTTPRRQTIAQEIVTLFTGVMSPTDHRLGALQAPMRAAAQPGGRAGPMMGPQGGPQGDL
jgi:hypothetical protein